MYGTVTVFKTHYLLYYTNRTRDLLFFISTKDLRLVLYHPKWGVPKYCTTTTTSCFTPLLVHSSSLSLSHANFYFVTIRPFLASSSSSSSSSSSFSIDDAVHLDVLQYYYLTIFSQHLILNYL